MRGLLPLLIGQTPISWESCQVTIHNWNSQWSRVSVLIYWYLCHVEPNLSLFHFHLIWKTVSISLCNLPGSCVLSDWNLLELSSSREVRDRNLSPTIVNDGVCFKNVRVQDNLVFLSFLFIEQSKYIFVDPVTLNKYVVISCELFDHASSIVVRL
jgi:hypothetical protein